jgi:hypothetical protein
VKAVALQQKVKNIRNTIVKKKQCLTLNFRKGKTMEINWLNFLKVKIFLSQITLFLDV